MPRGAKPGERRGGRVKGTPNRATIEKAKIAEQVMARAEMRGEQLAKEVLNDFMQLFAGMAATHQPIPEGQSIPLGRRPDETKFEKWARLAVQCAKDLAPYQSPTFRAIVVAPAPDSNQVERRKVFQLTIFENQRALPPPPGAPASDSKH